MIKWYRKKVIQKMIKRKKSLKHEEGQKEKEDLRKDEYGDEIKMKQGVKKDENSNINNKKRKVKYEK